MNREIMWKHTVVGSNAVTLPLSTNRRNKMNKNQELNSLENLWAPFIRILRVSGLYHFNGTQRHEAFWKFWLNPWKIYSALLFAFGLLVIISRLVSQVKDYNFGAKTAIYLYISNILYHVYVTVFIWSFFMASHSSTKLQRLYEIWSELRFCPEDAHAVEEKVKSNILVIILVSGLIAIISFAMVTINIYQRVEHSYWLFILSNYIMQSIECLSIAFVVVICSTISATISIFNSRFALYLHPTKSFLTMAQWTRLHSTYNFLVQLIKVADNILHFMLGCAIISLLGQVILFSSCIIILTDNTGLSGRFEILWWSLTMYLAIFLIFWKTAEANDLIYASYDDLSNVQISGFTDGLQTELLFFQNRLGNRTVGLTLFKMHIITRGILSTVASLYVTYLVIMTQL